MRFCHHSSHRAVWVIVLASAVAVLTTMAVLCVKLHWWDKLCRCCGKKKKGCTPAFSCHFDSDTQEPSVTDVVEKEICPGEDA